MRIKGFTALVVQALPPSSFSWVCICAVWVAEFCTERIPSVSVFFFFLIDHGRKRKKLEKYIL